MANQMIFNVCFVCLGNICRSPLAEGVFQDLVIRNGLEEIVLIHSAGTGGWHVGAPADQRMQETAKRHEIRLTSRAEQFLEGDFKRHDLILAMDRQNESSLLSLATKNAHADKVRLFRTFDPDHNGDLDVPDPYYGGESGFETVFDIVNRTCPQILKHIQDNCL